MFGEKRSKRLLHIKKVPAQVCENCGEEYLSSQTNNDLLKKAQDAVERRVDFEMLRFAA